MEITLLLIKKIVSLFIIMILGFLIVKLKIIKAEDSKVLSKILLYIVTPSVILNAFQIDFTPEILNGFLLCSAASVLFLAVSIGFNKLLEKPLKMQTVESLSVIYTNAANLIIPIVVYVLGENMVIYTTPLIVVQLVLFWTHLKTKISGEKKINWKAVITNLNIICVIIGFVTLLTGFKYPSLIKDTMASLNSLMGPASMLVIGMLIGGMDIKIMKNFKRLPLAVLLRLVVLPLIQLLICIIVPVERIMPGAKEVLFVTFLGIITPSATSVTQMAQVYGSDRDADYASAINVATTIMCIISMPVMVLLYQMFV